MSLFLITLPWLFFYLEMCWSHPVSLFFVVVWFYCYMYLVSLLNNGEFFYLSLYIFSLFYCGYLVILIYGGGVHILAFVVALWFTLSLSMYLLVLLNFGGLVFYFSLSILFSGVYFAPWCLYF